jgi:ferrochelatase
VLHPAGVAGERAGTDLGPGSLPAADERIGILLVNLGTPDAATPRALRRYLGEFLSDPRVIEIPRAAWWPILHGIVLRTRPAKSARKYAKIWTPEGSPLTVITARQAALLRGWLGERGVRVDVRWAMRYGRPAMAAELDALMAKGCTRVLVFPAYPQYCAATTASAFDAVTHWSRRTRRLPELRFVNGYAVEDSYVQALAARLRRHWQAEGRGRPLVLSFHGMPERTRDRGDPYHAQCLETARRLAAGVGLAADQVHVTFQSRFGAAAWLKPYTDESLAALARRGCEGVDVMCPGFASDCLETLEEIALEGRATFLAAGGKTFHYVPCLNDSPEGMRVLVDIALRHLQGWLPSCPSPP